MLDESSVKCPEVRPKVRPLVCPSHVSRGYSDGRTIGPGVLIVTRVPPAAWVAKDARLLRRSVLGYLVCVAVFWLFKCCRYSHLNSPTMGASLHNAVPFRPSSQGLRSLATLADAPDRCRCWPSDRIVTTHRPSGCGPNKLLSPETGGLTPFTTPPPDARAHFVQGQSDARVMVWISIFLYPNLLMANDNSPKASTKPVKVFRLRGISASVFENESENGSFFKVSVVRTYKDGKEFKSTPTFSRDDIPVMLHVATMAWHYVLQQEQEKRSSENSD